MSKIFGSAKDVENYHLELGHSKNFCLAPFITLLLEPDGKVGACRHKGSEFPVGNILTQSFDEIWNGPFIQNWRKEFLDGKPKVCSTEVKDRGCHHCPEYNSVIDSSEIAIKKTQRPLRLAFNFNGHCNLECQMCHIWKKPNGLYDRIGFWEKLDDWIQDLQVVELLSGEPFIQKDTYKLIDLISVKRPDAKWSITTNANWVLSDYIKEKLDKISVEHIIISLDSLQEETYSTIRKKGNLKKALKTLRDLKEYEKDRIRRGLSGLNIHVNFLFQKTNWKELGDIRQFGMDEDVAPFKTFLYEPAELSLLSCDFAEREEILKFYFNNLDVDNLKSSMRVIRPLLDSLTPISKFHFYNMFLDKINLSTNSKVAVNE